MYTSLKKSTTAAFAVVGLSTLSNAAEWNQTGNADWNNNAHWNNPSTFPNGIDAVADFTKANLSYHRTVTLNVPITVGSLMAGDSVGGSDYTFAPGASGSLTFDVSSGNIVITKADQGRNVRFDVPVTIMDNATITNADAGTSLRFNGGSVDIGSNTITFGGPGTIDFHTVGISGVGGSLIYNGTGTLSMRNTTAGKYSYTGNTVVNSGVYLGAHNNNGNLAPGNLKINEAKYQGYYNAGFIRPLGTGAGEFQLTGGTAAGFNYNNNFTIRFNNNANTVVQWGSAVFDPGTLLLGNTRTSGGGTGRIENIIDLNGAARTIDVTLGHAGLKWQLNGEIRDTAGGASLIKVGNGNLVLNKANTFTGNTEIQGGKVTLTAAGSLASAEIKVSAGATFDVSAKGGYTPAAGQKLSGEGTVTGAVTIASGSILAPGNSPGTTTYTSDQTWAGGGVYEWEIQDWNGSAGDPTGWDFVDISDAGAVDPTLDITATSGDPFVIQITEFSLTNFAPSATLQVFEIATAEGGITGFDADDFTLDTTNWTGGGIWNIVQSGNSIQLTHIPEPSTTALLGLGGLALVFRRRK